MRFFTVALTLALVTALSPEAGAQVPPTAYTAWADALSRLRVERNGCRRVTITQAPVAIAGVLLAGRGNPARDPASQTGKVTEFRYALGDSVFAASGFMTAGAAWCWAGHGVELRQARERGQRRGFGTPDLAAAAWSAMRDEAEHHVAIGRRVTIAGGALVSLGGIATLVHETDANERGLARIGAAPPLLIGGALAAAIGGAMWADGASRLASLAHVAQRSRTAWVALGPRGRHGIEARVTIHL